jgi:hypothetical protein
MVGTAIASIGANVSSAADADPVVNNHGIAMPVRHASNLSFVRMDASLFDEHKDDWTRRTICRESKVSNRSAIKDDEVVLRSQDNQSKFDAPA